MANEFGESPSIASNKFCPLTKVGIRRTFTVPLSFDISGSAAASGTDSGAACCYLGVNEGMTARVVRMAAMNTGASDKTGAASTEAVLAVYKNTVAGGEGLSLTIEGAVNIGATVEGSDDADGPVFGPTDQLIVLLTTAASTAVDDGYTAGDFTVSVDYVEGDE